jgi:hypothetical protein
MAKGVALPVVVAVKAQDKAPQGIGYAIQEILAACLFRRAGVMDIA